MQLPDCQSPGQSLPREAGFQVSSYRLQGQPLNLFYPSSNCWPPPRRGLPISRLTFPD
jgi:hypothetical protein